MNRGVFVGIAAYVLWGLSPIYWRLVDSVASGDVVIFRVVASALLLGTVHLVARTVGRVRDLSTDPAVRIRFVATALVLSSNWLVFVWAVSNDHVLQASLGYFINPLVSVVLGVVVLQERLRIVALLAVGLAAVGVVVLAVDVGEPPWVSLYLAGSFGFYGLLRKTSTAGSLDGLTLEVFVLLPVALIFLVVRAAGGDGAVGASVPAQDLWLLGTGVVTAGPLLLFAWAARRIELWLIGMLQFIAPTIQFFLGVFVWDEDWGGGQAVGFVIIWIALVIFVTESFVSSRRGAFSGDDIQRVEIDDLSG